MEALKPCRAPRVVNQSLNAQPIPLPITTPVIASPQRPGALRGSVVLTLQTSQAERLVRGRARSADKPAIIGLLGFAGLVRSVWNGARADDPYADWWLLKIHAALEAAAHALSQMDQVIVERLERVAALEVTLPASSRPARISLQFGNPYAFQATRVIGLFDVLACRILSARHTGALSHNEVETMLREGGRIVRHMLQSPVGYRFTGVTRRDFAQGTAKALQVQATLGPLPEQVVDGTCRAPHAPAIAPAPEAQSSDEPEGSHALVDLG